MPMRFWPLSTVAALLLGGLALWGSERYDRHLQIVGKSYAMESDSGAILLPGGKSYRILTPEEKDDFARMRDFLTAAAAACAIYIVIAQGVLIGKSPPRSRQ